MGRKIQKPFRGPSRDRTLPGKQRIRMRRYLKYLDTLSPEERDEQLQNLRKLGFNHV